MPADIHALWKIVIHVSRERGHRSLGFAAASRGCDVLRGWQRLEVADTHGLQVVDELVGMEVRRLDPCVVWTRGRAEIEGLT